MQIWSQQAQDHQSIIGTRRREDVGEEETRHLVLKKARFGTSSRVPSCTCHMRKRDTLFLVQRRRRYAPWTLMSLKLVPGLDGPLKLYLTLTIGRCRDDLFRLQRRAIRLPCPSKHRRRTWEISTSISIGKQYRLHNKPLQACTTKVEVPDIRRCFGLARRDESHQVGTLHTVSAEHFLGLNIQFSRGVRQGITVTFSFPRRS